MEVVPKADDHLDFSSLALVPSSRYAWSSLHVSRDDEIWRDVLDVRSVGGRGTRGGVSAVSRDGSCGVWRETGTAQVAHNTFFS